LEKIQKDNKTLEKITKLAQKKANAYTDKCLAFTIYGLVVSSFIVGFVVYFEVILTSKWITKKKASCGRVPYLNKILRKERVESTELSDIIEQSKIWSAKENDLDEVKRRKEEMVRAETITDQEKDNIALRRSFIPYFSDIILQERMPNIYQSLRSLDPFIYD